MKRKKLRYVAALQKMSAVASKEYTHKWSSVDADTSSTFSSCKPTVRLKDGAFCSKCSAAPTDLWDKIIVITSSSNPVRFCPLHCQIKRKYFWVWNHLCLDLRILKINLSPSTVLTVIKKVIGVWRRFVKRETYDKNRCCGRCFFITESRPIYERSSFTAQKKGRVTDGRKGTEDVPSSSIHFIVKSWSLSIEHMSLTSP